MLHAYLINPYIRTVEAIDIGDDSLALRAAVCRANRDFFSALTCRRLDHASHFLWTEDMAFHLPGLPVFRVGGANILIAGAAVVLRNGSHGNADVAMPIASLIETISWTDLETTGRLRLQGGVDEPILTVKQRANVPAIIAEVQRAVGDRALMAIGPRFNDGDVTDRYKIGVFDRLRDAIYGAAPKASEQVAGIAGVLTIEDARRIGSTLDNNTIIDGQLRAAAVAARLMVIADKARTALGSTDLTDLVAPPGKRERWTGPTVSLCRTPLPRKSTDLK